MADKRTTKMTVTVKIDREHSDSCKSEEWERYQRDMVRCPRYPQCRARGQLIFEEQSDSRIVKPRPGDIVKVAR